MMVVVMATSQHERFKLRDDDQAVNSKDSIRIIGFRNTTPGFVMRDLATTTAIGPKKNFRK